MRSSVFIWLFCVPFFQILTLIEIQFSSSLCLDDQRSLLLEFRSSLEFHVSKSLRLTAWNESIDCCEWNGVLCNSSSGQVIGLDLCGESITGGIDDSSSLFSLRFLQRLNLANNSFSGVIPSGFAKLSGLTYLNLSNAGFSGQVPVQISQLVKLITLDVSSNYLLENSTLKLENPSLAMLIRNFTDLRGLYLNGVVFSASTSTSDWWKALPISVPNLRFLSLSNGNISGEIDPSLAKLQFLSEIHLDQNNLAAPVPKFIADFRYLTLLKLSSCQLTGTFPQIILQVRTLRSVDLSYNEMLQGTLPEFPSRSFHTLVLSNTGFSGRLPDSIGNLSAMQRIDLQKCNFSGSIPSAVVKLNQLVYLDLSSNKFSGPIPSLSSVKNLTHLDLSYNQLSGTLELTSWGSLSNLVCLNLGANLLHGSIPTVLFSLPSMESMQLNQNKFNGSLQELPNMPSLVLNNLDLSNNNLKGSVPKSLFGLKGLKFLKLSANKFTGSLNLTVIQQLRNLSVLELSYNSLLVQTDDITADSPSFPQLSTLGLASCNLHMLPNFLRTQSKIKSLDLSDNRIQGTIPKWIWGVGNGILVSLNLSCNNFTSLERPFPETQALSVLDIHSNRIQGEVPYITSLNLVYLDCSNNSFTSISPGIGSSLSSATYISLSRNNIIQPIPATLCSATCLQVLDLSNNSLHGKIPDCVMNMTLTLGVLNLKENNLSSNILDAFPEGCSLSSINMGQNSLQGQIPKSLANCKQLEVLDLGRNQFHDTFPCWLKNLPNLQVLVLRANNFYGSAECLPSNKSWPVLQIIDLASNHFNGTLNAQCFLNLKALMTDEAYSPTSQLSYSVLRFDKIYDLYMVAVTFKGAEFNLQKTLTFFKCIDLSNNNFHGSIPETIGNLNAVIVFNLSFNALSGSIPSSIGNLNMLESLDLSHNNLSGSIPVQLSQLDFLEILNLSFNNFVGMIPKGTQLQSFDATSFTSNPGLCGPPLNKVCSNSEVPAPSRTISLQMKTSRVKAEFDWQFVLVGIGFGTGAAIVTALFKFMKKWRKWHDKLVYNFVEAILSACGIVEATLYNNKLEPEDGIKHQLFDITGWLNENEIKEEEDPCGRFCLFCSKLDIERKRVIHCPRCNCHSSLPVSSSSFN